MIGHKYRIPMPIFKFLSSERLLAAGKLSVRKDVNITDNRYLNEMP